MKISHYNDREILQNDLKALTKRAKNWLMDFNVKKCSVLTITRKHKTKLYEYTLLCEPLKHVKHNTKLYQYTLLCEPLKHVQKHDYLGVTISKDLTWNEHCSKVTNKVKRTLALIKRSLSSCSQHIKEKAYQTLVRPQIEYDSEVWNPNTATEINRLEHIQRNAARFVFMTTKNNHVTH